MRALGIKFFDEIIKAHLLLQNIFSGRSYCFFFECEMHSLVSAVLFRMSWFNAFDFNAKSEPPNGEFTQTKKRIRRRKRHAIICTNGSRKTVILKHSLKHTESHVLARGFQ